jgi:hypothetical protein
LLVQWVVTREDLHYSSREALLIAIEYCGVVHCFNLGVELDELPGEKLL